MGATTLHEMLNIPKKMERFVNDYKMLLVEARKNSLKLHNVNNKDLFNLLQILLDKSKPLNEIKEIAINYSREHSVDKSVIMTVAGATKCKTNYNALDRKEDLDMCAVFEETRIEGEAKQIVEMGQEFGLTDDDIVEKLQNKLGILEGRAEEYFAMFKK